MFSNSCATKESGQPLFLKEPASNRQSSTVFSMPSLSWSLSHKSPNPSESKSCCPLFDTDAQLSRELIIPSLSRSLVVIFGTIVFGNDVDEPSFVKSLAVNLEPDTMEGLGFLYPSVPYNFTTAA